MAILAISVAGCRSAQVEEPAPVVAPPSTRIVFGGDVMLSRHVGRVIRQQKDPAWPFREIAAYTSGADIAFLNLESPFSDRGQPILTGMVFKATPDTIEGLKLAGIDIVSTANNHARDCGDYGFEFTLNWLDRNGIKATGSALSVQALREGVILERNGRRFGFLAYTYDQSNGNHPAADDRIAMMDIARMSEDVAALRSRADVVIVSMHAGIEYRKTPIPQQIAFAHAAIDAGASVVVGHHPHVVQSTESYKNGVIFYSLGNLIFDQFFSRATQEGIFGEVLFTGAKIDSWAVKPVKLKQTVPYLTESGLNTSLP